MNILLYIHHYLFYLLLSLIIIIFIITLFFYIKKIELNNYMNEYNKLFKTLIFLFHIQILLGIILYIRYIYNITYISFYDIIKNNSLRIILLEHPIVMILSFILLLKLNYNIKRNKSFVNLKKINIFLLFIIVLLLIRVPLKGLLF